MATYKIFNKNVEIIFNDVVDGWKKEEIFSFLPTKKFYMTLTTHILSTIAT